MDRFNEMRKSALSVVNLKVRRYIWIFCKYIMNFMLIMPIKCILFNSKLFSHLRNRKNLGKKRKSQALFSFDRLLSRSCQASCSSLKTARVLFRCLSPICCLDSQCRYITKASSAGRRGKRKSPWAIARTITKKHLHTVCRPCKALERAREIYSVSRSFIFRERSE